MIEVAVIGGGIIGTAVARALQAEGAAVTIFDPDGAGSGAAVGSASYISVGEIFPLAHASVAAAMPRMLFDPLGPLVIRPSYLPRLAPWGLRFLASMHPSIYARNTGALASLNRPALKALLELAEGAGARELIDCAGGMLACERESTLRSLEPQIERLLAHHIDAVRLTSSQVRALEPALSSTIAGAIFFPGSARCTDPAAFCARLARAATAAGATVIDEPVRRIEPQPDGSWHVHARERHTARRVVVAAGVWSGNLLRPLGYAVPIEAERGYHLMLPHAGISVRRPMVFAERHFCVTGLDGGIRLAGTVEFAGTVRPMNPRRSDILYELASAYLPGLKRDGSTRWMGLRPSFPDSLPAIGSGGAKATLFYCFGHQHLGLTQAGISAKLIAAIVAGRPPEIDIAPFRLERFGTSANYVKPLTTARGRSAGSSVEARSSSPTLSPARSASAAE